MDLGGASTQISFIPENPSTLPRGYDYYLRLYGTDYHVYSHSYLCYGVNEAIRKYKSILVKVGIPVLGLPTKNIIERSQGSRISLSMFLLTLITLVVPGNTR